MVSNIQTTKNKDNSKYIDYKQSINYSIIRSKLSQKRDHSKETGENSEKHKYQYEDQHEGCNEQYPIDILLEISFIIGDTLHLKRSNTGLIDYDTKACYDSIIPLMLLLSYFKKGLPYEACVFFIHMLYNMRYYITTVFSCGQKQITMD